MRGCRFVFRLAALVLVGLAAYLALPGSIPQASAGTYGCGASAGCDYGDAYAACMVHVAYHRIQPNNQVTHCKDMPASRQWATAFANGATSGGGGTGLYSYRQNSQCNMRAPYTGTSAPYSTGSGYAVSGSLICNNGCTQQWHNNGDGTFTGIYSSASTVCTTDELRENCHSLGPGYAWNAYAGTCQPPLQECRGDQTKDPITGACKDACPVGMVVDATGACTPERSECPAGNIKSPDGGCLPGDGQCASGEVRRANGTCGKDADGDGVADVDDDDPDNDPKESAQGGETCDAPPACNGGAIDCMQVRIQWRIDCNTRRNRNISGGACNAMPVCAGDKCDAMEYAQLLQQWRATCHLEKLANSGLPGGGTGSGSNAMDPVSSDGVLGDDLDPSTVQRGFGGSWNGEGEDLAFDESGYGFARTCPTPPTLDVLGKSITFDTSVFCDWMRLGGVFVMIMAYLAGLSIVVRS